MYPSPLVAAVAALFYPFVTFASASHHEQVQSPGIPPSPAGDSCDKALNSHRSELFSHDIACKNSGGVSGSALGLETSYVLVTISRQMVADYGITHLDADL